MTAAKKPAALMLALVMMASLWIPTLTVPAQATTVTLSALA